jgi:hypothetical protein
MQEHPRRADVGTTSPEPVKRAAGGEHQCLERSGALNYWTAENYRLKRYARWTALAPRWLCSMTFL